MSFEENLTNIKKARFIDAVERASMCIGGAITPYVNFDGCDFPKHENAHIHVEQNIICVPDYYLKTATFEGLEETAVHEVAHILNQTHDADFQKKNVLIRSASWKPPVLPNRIRMDEYDKREFAKYMEEDLRKLNRILIDENGDEYFLKGRKRFKKYLKDEIPYYKPSEYVLQCQKRIKESESNKLTINERGEALKLSELKEFEANNLKVNNNSKSSEKIRAIEGIDTYSENIASATPKTDISQSKEESISKEPELHLEEEKIPEPRIVKPNENHICQYCFKKVSQVYKCTKCNLELCSKHASNHSCIKGTHPEPESGHPPVWVERQDTPIKSLNWNAIIIIIIIICFGIILSFFIISSFLDSSNSQDSVTPSNSNKDNTEKVANPIPAPKDIFGKINEYREQNKKYNILWSDDAYRLADFRASDMIKRNYYSHTTPDGKTVSDYIGKYNFYSDSTWGENLCKGCSDPTQTWIGSAGDRGVLLGGWGKGAVACESDICVFIGVNENH